MNGLVPLLGLFSNDKDMSSNIRYKNTPRRRRDKQLELFNKPLFVTKGSFVEYLHGDWCISVKGGEI